MKPPGFVECDREPESRLKRSVILADVSPVVDEGLFEPRMKQREETCVNEPTGFTFLKQHGVDMPAEISGREYLVAELAGSTTVEQPTHGHSRCRCTERARTAVPGSTVRRQ